MADEYMVRVLDAQPPFMSELAKMLTQNGCVVEAEHNDGLLLRWRNSPRRKEWSEDITLLLVKGKLLLSVHSGTKVQRGLLIQTIEEALSKAHGTSVSFEEA